MGRGKSGILWGIATRVPEVAEDKQAIADLEAYKSQAEIEKLNKSVVQSYWNGKWNERRPAILDELFTQGVKNHGSSEINGIEE